MSGVDKFNPSLQNTVLCNCSQEKLSLLKSRQYFGCGQWICTWAMLIIIVVASLASISPPNLAKVDSNDVLWP